MSTQIIFNLPVVYLLTCDNLVSKMNNWLEKNNLDGRGYLHKTLIDKGVIEVFFNFTTEQDAVIFYFHWSNQVGIEWNII